MSKKKQVKSSTVRQGDVLLVPCAKPNDGKEIQRNRVTLALGEVTGHAHTIECEGVALFEATDGKRMLWVEVQTTVHHQEHDFGAATGVANVVAPGWYEVVSQVEEDPLFGIRKVVD